MAAMTEEQRIERDTPMCAAIRVARDLCEPMLWPINAGDSMLEADNRVERVADWAEKAQAAGLALLAAATLARQAIRP